MSGFPVGRERSRLDSFDCWKVGSFHESLTGVEHCGIAGHLRNEMLKRSCMKEEKEGEE